ncbi:MAG: hypothetical protein RIT45_185 [Pseudomonadota bacterium]
MTRARAELWVVWPLALPLWLGATALLAAIDAAVAGVPSDVGRVVVAALVAAMVFAVAGAGCAALPPAHRDRAAGGLAGLLTGLLVLGGLDLLAFSRANQGLGTLLELWHAEGGAGLRATLEASGVGTGLVVLVLSLPWLFGGATWLLWSALAERPRATVLLGARPLLGVGGALLLLTLWLDDGAMLGRRMARLYGPERRAAQSIPADATPPALRLRTPLPGEGFAPRTLPERPARAEAPRLLLFVVVESLRADAVEPTVMPALAAWAERATRPERVYAAGNATHPGWYTLFFGRWSHLWHRVRRGAEPGGALPLRLLAGAGYRVELYGGAELDYYGFDHQLCGPGGRLCAVRVDPRGADPALGGQRAALDHRAVDLATAALAAGAKSGERQAVFVFLDGTHFPWDWLPGAAPAFAPVASAEALRAGQLDATGSPGVRNRYRSALGAIDAQLGRLFAAAEAADPDFAWVVTGDHGEELLEHGRLSHDSELCDVQVRVPLLLRLPGLQPGARPVAMSHVDVMPTLLHAFGLLPDREREAGLRALLHGQPLQVGSRPFALVVDTTAGSPARAALVDTRPEADGERLELLFSNREDVLESDRLHLLRVADRHGRTRRHDLDALLRDPAAAAAFRARWLPGLRALFGADPESFGDAPTRPPPGTPPYLAQIELLGARGAASVDLAEPVTAQVALLIHNVGGRAWLHDVQIGHRWIGKGGLPLGEFDALYGQPLGRSVAPGERTAVLLTLSRPPAGATALDIDLQREGVTWFRHAGSHPLRLPWPPPRDGAAGPGATSSP